MDYIMLKFGLGAQLNKISQMHGKIFQAHTGYGKIKIIPLYHPAVAIYNRNTKDELVKDFQVLKDFRVDN